MNIIKKTDVVIILVIVLLYTGGVGYLAYTAFSYIDVRNSNDSINQLAGVEAKEPTYMEEVKTVIKDNQVLDKVFGEQNDTQEIVFEVNTNSSNKDKEGNVVKQELTLPNINFDNLLKQNKDVIAWLCIPNLGISYPVVRSEDNQDYVRRDLYGKYSKAGTLFTDCRCATPYSQKTIIYGHNMKDGSMFNKLYTIQELPINEQKVYVLRPGQPNLVYKVNSVDYTVKTDSEVYSVNYTDDTDLLVLSTCVKDEKRFVVTCKLTER